MCGHNLHLRHNGNQKRALYSLDRCHMGNILYKEYINIFAERNLLTLSVLPMHHILLLRRLSTNLCDGVQVCLNSNLSEIVTNLQRFEPTPCVLSR